LTRRNVIFALDVHECSRTLKSTFQSLSVQSFYCFFMKILFSWFFGICKTQTVNFPIYIYQMYIQVHPNENWRTEDYYQLKDFFKYYEQIHSTLNNQKTTNTESVSSIYCFIFSKFLLCCWNLIEQGNTSKNGVSYKYLIFFWPGTEIGLVLLLIISILVINRILGFPQFDPGKDESRLTELLMPISNFHCHIELKTIL